MNRAAIILAAGQGTRMNSDLPKVLHRVEGRYLLEYVIDAIRQVLPDNLYIVIGYKAEQVRTAFEEEELTFVMQREQLGTGHAVLQCEPHLSSFEGTVLVMNGDVPGLRPQTIERFLRFHERAKAAATVLTALFEQPAGYGRIIKNDDGSLVKIVEDRDATPAEKEIREINSGLICFDKRALFATLMEVGRENEQREYYLTDVIGIMQAHRLPVAAFCVDDPMEVAGVNTVAELNAIGDYLKRMNG